jgi:hypothetical protein
MPDHRFGDHFNDGADGHRDDGLDEQIRALLSRAVAQAPPAPPAGEIDARGARDVPVEVIRLAGPRPQPTAGRSLLVVAASVAVIVLAVAGAVALGPLGDPSDDTAMQGESLAVRYVPAELPAGLRLTGVDSSPPAEPDPVPRVSVFEGGGANDDVTVRITVGPADWADGTADATSALSSATSGTTTPASTTDPTSTTTPDASTTSTSSTTTTAPAAPDLPSVPGLPARWGLVEAQVRGGPGGIELHDPDTTTAWFADEGRLVAVDVFGMGRDAALRLVDDLRRRADGAGFEPDPGDGFERVGQADAPAANVAAAATARLVFGDGALVVTNVRLASGRDDLLTATAGSFGTLERWGGREVLVDTGLDGGAISQASFVDRGAGVLVTVRGPTGELQPYVERLRRVDPQGWAQFVSEHAASRGSTVPDTVPDTTAGPTPTGS